MVLKQFFLCEWFWCLFCILAVQRYSGIWNEAIVLVSRSSDEFRWGHERILEKLSNILWELWNLWKVSNLGEGEHENSVHFSLISLYMFSIEGGMGISFLILALPHCVENVKILANYVSYLHHTNPTPLKKNVLLIV